MGANLSRFPLTVFEIFNELFITISTGVVGLSIMTNHGIRNNQLVATLAVTCITIGSLIYVFSSHEMAKPTQRKIVLITGCDSGLGFSLALHASEMGFTVLAGCYNLDSDGALKLMKSSEFVNLRIFQLDVTDDDSVTHAVKIAKQILEEHRDNVLWAIINNAGIMVFGEFEWQTERLITEQIEVNLLGTMRVSHKFSAMLRHSQGRLINVSSHCALASLPGLATYGASKSGVQAFTDAIRVELTKYGVKVISLIPGSFCTQSNILSRQMEYVYEMRAAFNDEQLDFYGPYFTKYNAYLSAINTPSSVRKIFDPELYERFECAMLSKTPNAMYVVAPWRYSIYHTMFKWVPYYLRDWLVQKFMQMPEYECSESTDSVHDDVFC